MNPCCVGFRGHASNVSLPCTYSKQTIWLIPKTPMVGPLWNFDANKQCFVYMHTLCLYPHNKSTSTGLCEPSSSGCYISHNIINDLPWISFWESQENWIFFFFNKSFSSSSFVCPVQCLITPPPPSSGLCRSCSVLLHWMITIILEKCNNLVITNSYLIDIWLAW